jgi:hypothetical protein
MLHKIKGLLFIAIFFFNITSFGQLPFQLKDARLDAITTAFNEVLNEKPPEVLFGIFTDELNDVYFSMNNKEWFNKIIKNESYGIAVDFIAKEKYKCNTVNVVDNRLPLGTILKPVYKKELLQQNNSSSENEFIIKIGSLPTNLVGKEFEGNLIFCIGKNICYYSTFINIDRSELSLLPMGLFTDSLLQENNDNNNLDKPDFFIYSKRIQLEIPFQKSGTTFSSTYLQKFYDSLNVKNLKIKKIEIRAYASVEGSLQINTNLMQLRAEAIVKDLSKYEPNLKRIKIITAENWIEFFNSSKNTANTNLQKLSKEEIKQKLTNTTLSNQLEPSLSTQRKAVITYFIEEKSIANNVKDNLILSGFKSSVDKNDLKKAKAYQKELVERIIDNKLPLEYISKLEVPKTKEFAGLINDNEVYKYLLKATTEYEALNNFIALQKQDPTNGKINYNICALRFFVIKNGEDKTMMKPLFAEINKLQKQNINSNLVKRMLINYNILKAEIDFNNNNYAAKDSAVNSIAFLYNAVDINDEEVYALAKFYANYAHYDWAEQLISPRIDKINTSEDLVFYYLNLQFYNPAIFENEKFQKAILNAVNLNKNRWCKFFSPNDKGGASVQLLQYQALKKRYCESCK